MRICEVEDCNRPHHAKGMCQSHYKSGKSHKIRSLLRNRPERDEVERLLGLGLSAKEIHRLMGIDPQTVSREFPDRPKQTSTGTRDGRYRQLLPLVQSGTSLNEIRRTIGMDYRTVRSYFPHYKPFEVGGGGRANDIRKANEDLRKMDGHGNIAGRKGRA